MVMLTTIGAVVAVGIVSTVTARKVLPLNKRAVAFFDPIVGGGSWLDNAGSGGGEPLNVSASPYLLHTTYEPLFNRLLFPV